MPIRKYLQGNITSKVARTMLEGFGLACRYAKERGLDSISNQAIATKVYELANSGETNPKRIAEMALTEILERRQAS